MTTNRMAHTNCTHASTPKDRAACRKARATTAPIVTTPIITVTSTNDFTITTPAGKIRVGSVIIADDAVTYTVLDADDDMKNGYAGWVADGRWGYADQVVRVVKF
jgi:hypothetical protein